MELLSVNIALSMEEFKKKRKRKRSKDKKRKSINEFAPRDSNFCRGNNESKLERVETIQS